MKIFKYSYKVQLLQRSSVKGEKRPPVHLPIEICAEIVVTTNVSTTKTVRNIVSSFLLEYEKKNNLIKKK